MDKRQSGMGGFAKVRVLSPHRIAMYAVISEAKTQLPPGTVVHMPGTWQDYQALCQSRGEDAVPRLRYRAGELSLMSPLPQHGREANILADIVKALLDSQSRNYEAFTPITLDLPEDRGIEPGYCFYIDNWQAVTGKDRIDWQTEPPPDLVLEIDVTHFTAIEDYLPYRCPEVWLYRANVLSIYRLAGTQYIVEPDSRYFPGGELAPIVTQVFEVAARQGSGSAVRSLRHRLQAE